MTIQLDKLLSSLKGSKQNSKFSDKQSPVRVQTNSNKPQTLNGEDPSALLSHRDNPIRETNFLPNTQSEEDLKFAKKYAQLQSNLSDKVKTGLDKLNNTIQSLSDILSSTRQQMKQRTDSNFTQKSQENAQKQQQAQSPQSWGQ